MTGERRRAPSGRRPTAGSFAEGGFSALELLVVIVIVCTVVAISVPALHSRAKSAVLDTNMHTLAAMITSQVLEGYSTDYNPPVNGFSDYYLNDHLTTSLATAGQTSFVNPCVGGSDGRAVVNSDTLPADPQAKAPAVFVTDCAEAQYAAFDSLPAAARHPLAGSLVVEFDSASNMLDVFFVDGGGNKSPNAVQVPMA
jgi:type II secretory pathway pseudopilin PulG